MKSESMPAAGGDAAAPALGVERVSFTYQGAARAALRNVSFSLLPGEMVGVMGASGAGKSTLAKCLNRIIPEFEDGGFSGVVRIGGRALKAERVCEVAASVGMVFQDFESQLFSTNVAHEVAFAMEQVGMSREEMAARIAPALAAVGLSGFEHRDPTSLSGGEKQRLAIASVLALRPRVMVLDEPTTDLDPEGKAEVFALIGRLREQGLSLVVIEHESEELRRCDRLLLINGGEIVADAAPASLMTRLDLLERSGVHPPSLDELFARLGIGGHARDLDHAEAAIRRMFPAAPRAAVPGRAQDWPLPAPAPPAHQAGSAQGQGEPLAELQGLTFAYPDGPTVLDSVDLKIAPGDFLAIIGQNGSGKTTLAKHLVGLLKPAAGRVMLGGRDRAALRPAETAEQVGYVFQNPDHQIFAPTVEDEVAFGPRNFGLPRAEVERRIAEALRAVGLDGERQSDPFLLSKGERQRLAVASVMALKPRLLILDEPTTGLDYREQRRMMALVSELNRAGIAIMIITHTPYLVAEYARRVVLLKKGRKLFDSTVRELFESDELLAGSSFRPPEVTALSRRFGTVALNVEEFAGFLRAAR